MAISHTARGRTPREPPTALFPGGLVPNPCHTPVSPLHPLTARPISEHPPDLPTERRVESAFWGPRRGPCRKAGRGLSFFAGAPPRHNAGAHSWPPAPGGGSCFSPRWEFFPQPAHSSNPAQQLHTLGINGLKVSTLKKKAILCSRSGEIARHSSEAPVLFHRSPWVNKC